MKRKGMPAVRTGFCSFIVAAGVGKFLIGLVATSSLLTCIKTEKGSPCWHQNVFCWHKFIKIKIILIK